MKIPSKDVPQADILEDVIKIVEAVGEGAHTFQDLSKHIQKVERQGRYYRRAAEILGFIKNQANNAILTPMGKKYLSSSPHLRKELLEQAVLSSRMIQRIIPFLEGKGSAGASREELQEFIETVTEKTGPSMIPRRVSSVIAWLSEIGILKQNNSRFVLGSLPQSVGLIEYTTEDEPLFPQKYDLNEYQNLADKTRSRIKSISILVDEAKKDRAVKSHQMLTNLTANKIRAAGAIPKRNPYIDLSTRIGEQIYIFEMKSSNDENVHNQVRRGVSQLYEYRYIQQIKEANLVLVIENKLPPKQEWLADYLLSDRGIFLVWDGDREKLYCPDSIKETLSFVCL